MIERQVPKHAAEMSRRAVALIVGATAGTNSTRRLALSGDMLDDLTPSQLRSLSVFLALHSDLALIAETASTIHTPEAVVHITVELSAARFGVTTDDILSNTRRREVVEARHAAMYAARLAGLSLPKIGAEYGKDHTTVLHAVTRVGENARLRRIANRIAADLNSDRREAS